MTVKIAEGWIPAAEQASSSEFFETFTNLWLACHCKIAMLRPEVGRDSPGEPPDLLTGSERANR